MDIIHALLHGLSQAVAPHHLAWAMLGCLLGTAAGVLPGLGPTVFVAILMPITAQVDITSVLILFACIYYGSMYGGANAAILLDAPNRAAASTVTALEGYRMAVHGRSGAALAAAVLGSFVAGLMTSVFVTVAAPGVAHLARHLDAPEYFMLMVLACAAVSAVLGRSTLRGVTALTIGIALGCIGADPVDGTPRYTVGLPLLADGLEPALAVIGLFAVAPVLHAALYEGRTHGTFQPTSRVGLTRAELRRCLPAWLRGTAIGIPFGCAPAGGAEIPTILSYAGERQTASAKAHAEFGHDGAIEGVAGPEAANNATATAALIPLLTLGIPTSNTTAMLLSTFQHYDIQPGPQLFESATTLVWTLIASLYLGNLILLALNLPLAGAWSRLLRIPRPQLHAVLLVLATLGAYSLRQNVWDLVLLYGLGLLGMLMRRLDFAPGPVIVGMVLGPVSEAQLRQAVAMGEGSVSIFVARPLSLMLIVLVLGLLILPRLLQHWAERRIAQTREQQLLQAEARQRHAERMARLRQQT